MKTPHDKIYWTFRNIPRLPIKQQHVTPTASKMTAVVKIMIYGGRAEESGKDQDFDHDYTLRSCHNQTSGGENLKDDEPLDFRTLLSTS